MVSFEICKGNPGCMQFLMTAYREDPIAAEEAFRRMQIFFITGSNLYMLWNDCCGRDTKLAVAIARNLPIEEIRRHINYQGGRGIPFTEEEITSALTK